VLFLGESLSLMKVSGGLIVILGVAFVSFEKQE